MKPTTNKINELKSFPYSKDTKTLHQFLGMIGFYRKLIPNFVEIVLPLTEKMRTATKGSIVFTEKEM